MKRTIIIIAGTLFFIGVLALGAIPAKALFITTQYDQVPRPPVLMTAEEQAAYQYAWYTRTLEHVKKHRTRYSHGTHGPAARAAARGQ